MFVRLFSIVEYQVMINKVIKIILHPRAPLLTSGVTTIKTLDKVQGPRDVRVPEFFNVKIHVLFHLDFRIPQHIAVVRQNFS